MKAKVKSTRTFGVEIEFVNNSEFNQNDLAKHINNKFRNIDVAAESWNHTTRDHWKIVTDSSCGLELVSPVLEGKKGVEEARKVIDALNNVDGVIVNRHCGIHVHVGISDISVKAMKNILIHYGKNEELIESILAPSRRATSRWANSLLDARMMGNHSTSERPHQNMEEFRTWLNQFDSCGDMVTGFDRRYRTMARYRTVNVQAYHRQRTIEFRQHGGSMDSEKILNWTIFLTNMVDKCVKATNMSVNIKDDKKKAFKALFGDSKVIYDYMLKRAKHFGYDCYGDALENTLVERRMFDMRNSDCRGNIIIDKYSNGSYVVRDVDSSRQSMLEFLQIEDEGQTTRQLGAMCFAL
jgi:hypothetical protein